MGTIEFDHSGVGQKIRNEKIHLYIRGIEHT